MSDTADVTLLLSEPPSTNRLFREVSVGGRARRVRTSEYNRWRESAAFQASVQLGPVPAEGGFITGPYRLRIFVPKQRGRDLGNNEKPISDLLQHARVVRNDLACVDIQITRDLSREPGHVLVQLWRA